MFDTDKSDRRGLPWTAEEDAELMARARRGTPLEDIAAAHGRSMGAVKTRVVRNAVNMLQDQGLSIEEVSRLVHVPIDDLKIDHERLTRQTEMTHQEDKKPSRVGQKWTAEEDACLMERAMSGNMSLEEMAEAHGRSWAGVKARIAFRAVNMMRDQGLSFEDVSRVVHLPVEDIQIEHDRLVRRTELNQLKKTRQPAIVPEKKAKGAVRSNMVSLHQQEQELSHVMDFLTEIRDLLRIIATDVQRAISVKET